MADVTMTVYDASRAQATAPNYTDNKTAATSGNNYYIPNNGRVALIVVAGTTATVTVATPGTVDGNAVADLAITLPDTDQIVLGPFPTGTYNDPQGRLLVTVSAATSLFAVRV